MADPQGDGDDHKSLPAERDSRHYGQNGRDAMEHGEVAHGRIAGHERPALVTWMVDAVDVLVRNVVQTGRRDIARGERKSGPDISPRKRGETVRERCTKQHEQPQHERDPVAEHPHGQLGSAHHFGTTTLRGQVAASAST